MRKVDRSLSEKELRRSGATAPIALPQIIHTPQLILSTATFHGHLNRFLFQGSGWLTRGDVHLIKIDGALEETETSPWLPNATHPFSL